MRISVMPQRGLILAVAIFSTAIISGFAQDPEDEPATGAGLDIPPPTVPAGGFHRALAGFG